MVIDFIWRLLYGAWVWTSDQIGILASITTVIALGVLIGDIRAKQKRDREDRSFQLLEMYFEQYHDLLRDWKLPSTLEELKNFEDAQFQELRRRTLERKNETLMLFIKRLAMYWKRGLLDKDMIKEQMGPKLIFECFILETTYQDRYKDVSSISDLIAMSRELARVPVRFQWLIDFLVKYKIAR